MKSTKAQAEYTPTAVMRSERCGLCEYFQPKAEACTKVRGQIVSGGWCKLFARAKETVG